MKPNLELLREAAAIIDGIPAKRIDMSRTHDGNDDPHDCGTVACALGWLGMHPKFQSLGLRTSRHTWLANILWNGVEMDFDEAAAALFGLSQIDAAHMFSPNSTFRSDKAEFRRRVVEFLKEHQ